MMLSYAQQQGEIDVAIVQNVNVVFCLPRSLRLPVCQQRWMHFQQAHLSQLVRDNPTCALLFVVYQCPANALLIHPMILKGASQLI